MANSLRRLNRDLKWFQLDPPDGITVYLQDEDMMILNAVIIGPGESPWDGGKFKLILNFPVDFPFNPPKARFVSPMFHPNVNGDGRICLDILEKEWIPGIHVAAILVSIQSLLCDPNPNSPANSEAARMFIENRREYNQKIREIVEQSWTVA